MPFSSFSSASASFSRSLFRPRSPPADRYNRNNHNRRRIYSLRPFFLTLVVVTGIVALSSLRGTVPGGNRVQNKHLLTRNLAALSSDDDLECRLVHHAEDKCAFVQAHCPDEEAGIFSYLSLYYCRLPHAQPLAFTFMVFWLGLLFSTIGIAASDFFCVNLSTISNLLGMSESLAGVTFLAFGNGSPDVFSTFAAMSTNSGSLALGELIGAASFITAVVAGSMALVRPFQVARRSFVRDVGFFTVAASFSMIFLYDGKLYLWECIAMVAFYLFYVVFVVAWHWLLSARRQRRLKEAAVRGHFVLPGGEEEEVRESYHDDEDADSSHSPLRNISNEDFSNLERGNNLVPDEMDEYEAEEAQERMLGELNSNMRLSRPRMRERGSTQTPIRPSLVGALEFRAVLASLRKSRATQTIPMGFRRYSDDPTMSGTQQAASLPDEHGLASDLPLEAKQHRFTQSLAVRDPSSELGRFGTKRARAVSANDADGLRWEHDISGRPPPTIDLLGPLPEDGLAHDQGATSWAEQIEGTDVPLLSPAISISPTPSAGPASPIPHIRLPSPDRLAPPDQLSLRNDLRTSGSGPPSKPPSPSLRLPPVYETPPLYRSSSPPSPFPLFADYSPSPHSSRPPSIRLPLPSLSPQSLLDTEQPVEEEQGKPLRWWPYAILPAPSVLGTTLFPTLYGWREKNLWEKFLGVVAAPSVFLLTVTLPVVETPKEESSELDDPNALDGFGAPHDHNRIQDGLTEPESFGMVNGGLTKPGGVAAFEDSSCAALATENHRVYNDHHPHNQSATRRTTSPDNRDTENQDDSAECREWNRWLVFLQIFTAPFFIVLIVWANTNPGNARALVKPVLYSLLASLCLAALLVRFTSPYRPPVWRAMLCFAGFVVSISWISTIANEVVGVLKTIGVILNISDAILGLTVFAVGNSLGDLVADITVARLGYPVMALSACFGGPMLNILLGIGLSGCYMTIKGAKQKQERHPDRPIKFRPYHVDVSSTLVISGTSLLVTLVALLVAVPLRKWRMDRVVGWCLVALWVCSTVGNVVAELLGWEG